MAKSATGQCALLLGCIMVPVAAGGQSGRPLFGVGFGLAVSNGAYHSDGNSNGEGFDTGWVGTMHAGFKLPKVPVVIRLSGSYSANGANEQLKGALTNALGRPTDAKFHLLGALVDAGYEFGTSFRRVYLFGGGGPHRVRLSVTSGGVTADTSATKFAWTVGGGIVWDVSRSNTGIFLEARYVHVAAAFDTPPVTFMPLMLGIRFGGGRRP